MNKYLYKIKDLEVPPWLKYWFARKSKVNFDLSQILNGTSFDLTDTVNKKLHLIDIFGNSKQETTTGKNLLNPYLSNTTTHGVTVTYDENTQEITLNGTCNKDNTTFIFTSTPEFNLPKNNNIYGLIKYISGQSNGFFSLRAFNNNYSVSLGVITNNPINTDIIYNRTFSVDALFTSFSIRVDEGSTFDNLKIKLMISKVDAVYEPYTDGASPNPEYPQEVNSSGDNGYIVEKFVNKNLFDKNDKNIINCYFDTNSQVISNVSSNYRTIYIPCKENTIYTISKIKSARFSVGYTSEIPTSGIIVKNVITNNNATSMTLEGQTDVKYIVAFIYHQTYDTTMTIEQIINSLQIEEGSAATNYVEHQEQVFTIPCQQPMRAIGDVKDTFVKVDGVWYERHNIKREIARGNQNWWKSNSNLVDRYYKNLDDGRIYDSYSSQKSYCNNYTWKYNAGDINIFYLGSYQEKLRIFINYSDIETSTLQDFKDFLEEKFNANDPVYYDYELKEPIDLPCTQAQITALEALMKARTYKDVTHIYSEDEVPADLEIQYYKEKGE